MNAEKLKELKPCPFCGGRMMLRAALWPRKGDCDAIIHAKATDCAMGQFCDGTFNESIVERWNARNLAASMPSEQEIAQVLVDRFLERCDARGNVSNWKLGTKLESLPPSYRDDFEKDARAILDLIKGGGK